MKSPKSEKDRLDKVTVQAITSVAQGLETKIEKTQRVQKLAGAP